VVTADADRHARHADAKAEVITRRGDGRECEPGNGDQAESHRTKTTLAEFHDAYSDKCEHDGFVATACCDLPAESTLKNRLAWLNGSASTGEIRHQAEQGYFLVSSQAL
jgi:hypothetical protein